MKDIKIGLIGKARSGKDTVANILVNKYGMMRFAFGDELKNEFHKEYPHIPREPKPVRAYQLYGQLKRITDGKEVWIDKCSQSIEKAGKYAEELIEVHGSQDYFSPVITDVRQWNEYFFCKHNGFYMIKVEAPNSTREERIRKEKDLYDNEVDKFETETELDEFKPDMTIFNEGTLEDLEATVDKIVRDLRKEKEVLK